MANKKRLTKKIRQKAHKNIDRIMDKTEAMKKKVSNLKNKSSKIEKNVKEYIQKNPIKSILIATGIGAALGAILAAIRKRKE